MAARTIEPEDFEVAVALMKGLGWHQGSSIGPGGSICAARALNMAARLRDPNISGCDLDRARKILGLDEERWGSNPSAIPRWNDAMSTTFALVEDRFKIAAMRMRTSWGAQDARDDT